MYISTKLDISIRIDIIKIHKAVDMIEPNNLHDDSPVYRNEPSQSPSNLLPRVPLWTVTDSRNTSI